MTLFGFKQTTLLADLRRTLALALPLIGAQLLQMGNGLVDALVAGRLGRAELAAGGIAGSLWFFVSLLCIGLMAGLSPTLSKLIGERRRAFVGTIFRQGLWLGLFTGVIATLALLVIAYKLDGIPLQPELISPMRQYLFTACWSLPFFALVLASRNVCEATGLTRPVLLVQVLGLCVNIVVNLALGLGWFGFPRLGMVGIGLSTSFVMLAMAVAFLWMLRGQRFARYNLFSGIDRPAWIHLGPMLVLSIPIFLALVFEAGLFVATGIQAGIIGTLESGAHNIAISASAFCYMLPLGLSFALTARMGRVYGAQQWEALKLRIVTGILLTVIMAMFTASLLILFRHSIPGLYTNDEKLRQFAAGLLLLGAVFQLSDGAQATLLGMLRGIGDTRVPMLINAFSYWAIAFGLGLFAAHVLNWGAYGLWFGLIVGLTVASFLLGWRLHVSYAQVRANTIETQSR